MTRSRACCSSAAPTRTGASPRRPRVERCRRRRAPASASWSSCSSRTARIRTAAWTPPATRCPRRPRRRFARFSWLAAERPIPTTRAGSTTMRNSGAWREIQRRPCASRPASRWSSGMDRRDRLERLLAAGLRVPPVLTGCQSYLLAHTDMLRTLLAHGMSPDLMNWQHQTLLHLVCRGTGLRGRDRADGAIERAAILLDAGARHLCARRGISIDAARVGGAHERRGDGGVSPRARRPDEPSRR